MDGTQQRKQLLRCVRNRSDVLAKEKRFASTPSDLHSPLLFLGDVLLPFSDPTVYLLDLLPDGHGEEDRVTAVQVFKMMGTRETR